MLYDSYVTARRRFERPKSGLCFAKLHWTLKREGPMTKTPKPAKLKLLSGGNPQIAKAYGDAPVQAYIAAMPDWKRDVGHRLDALITSTIPGVYKAVKYNSPLYGIESQG